MRFFSLIKSLWQYVRQYRWQLLIAMFLSLPLSFVKIGQTMLIKPLLDEGLDPNEGLTKVFVLVSLLIGIAILNFPCRFFHFYLIRTIVQKASFALQQRMLEKIQKLPMSYLDKQAHGNLFTKVTSDAWVFSGSMSNVITFIREPIVLLGLLGLAFYTDWQLTLFLIIVIPMFRYLFIRIGEGVRKYQHKVQEDIGRLSQSIGEGIRGQKVIKVFNLQKYIISKFIRVENIFFSNSFRTIWYEEISHPISEFLLMFSLAAMVLIGHYRISTGVMTLGSLVTFVGALLGAMDPIKRLVDSNNKMNQSIAAFERINQLLNLPEEVDLGTTEITKFNDKITIKNLTFAYDDRVVLDNISLEIKKGSKIGLVGASGGGKSTLINLLVGLYSNYQGEILVDGISIRDIKLSNLRSLFALVNQEIFLFHDTLISNIILDGNFSKEEIEKVIKDAYIHDFLPSLPAGESTIIGEGGILLSGGQRQRVTLARAFLHHADILLFDEATSALDNKSERIIQEALGSSKKTIIAVAHRLSTVQDFDEIVVIKDGKIMERGNHFELIAKKQEYYKLYQMSEKDNSNEYE